MMYNSEEASEIPWSYNKTKNEFKELTKNSWRGKVFEFQEESEVKKLKDDTKEKIINGYNGTITSKEFSNIYKEEQNNNKGLLEQKS